MLASRRRAIRWRGVRHAVSARAVTVGGALALIASLWTTWGFDRAVEPDARLTAWQAYPLAATLLAGLAVATLAGAAMGGARRGALLAGGAGALAALDAVALLVVSSPGRGARVALLAAALVIGAAAAWGFGTLEGTATERWRALPRALMARVVVAVGATLVVVSLWAPWAQALNAWEAYRATDAAQLVLGVVALAAAAVGKRAGAVSAGVAGALVAANTLRLIAAGAPTAGTQLSLLGSGLVVLGAVALFVEMLPGDPVERWRTVAPDLVLRILTAVGAAGLLIPFSSWRASPPLLAVLVVVAAAALVSAALRSRRHAAALGIAAGAVAIVAIFAIYRGPGFLRAAQVGFLGAALIAASAGLRLADRHPQDTVAGWRDVSRAALAVLGSSWLWAALVTASVYPFAFTITPGVRLDESWIEAMYLASARGLDFGTNVVFTYGPLGYLTLPRFVVAGLFEQSVAYVMVAYFAAAFAIVATARRTFGLVIAVVLAVFTLDAFRLVSPEESTQVAAASATLLAASAMLHSRSFGRSRWWWWAIAAMGLVAALHALIKLNTGVLIVLLAGLGVLGGAAPGRRLASVGVLAGAFWGSLVALWLALGQDLGALGGYLTGSYEVVRGFPEAMAWELGDQQVSDYAWAAGVTAAIAVVAAFSARALGWWRVLALFAALAVFEYSWFKQGFVRHEVVHHVLMFFAVAVPAIVAAARPRPPWAVTRGRLGAYAGTAVACGAVAVAIGAYVAVSHISLGPFHDTQGSLHAYRQLSEFMDTIDESIPLRQAYVRDVEKVDPQALSLLHGHTVHIAPFEAAVAWGYPDLRWRPLPTIQHYVAYTPELDRRNVEALADDRRAPERILRAPADTAPTESPGAMLETLCRYREQYASEGWQVLARVPNRCGPLQPLTTVRVAPGRLAPVPEPGPNEAILFTVEGLELSPLERLRSLLWKPRPRFLVFGDSPVQIGPEMASVPTLARVGSAAEYPGAPLIRGWSDVGGRVTTDGVTGPAKPLPRELIVRFFKVRLSGAGAA